MADKRISQLVDRGTIANNDVVPIVVSGATTTNKATISSIQTFMQGNLDLGVTSVGITLGSSGTDVSVTGSPITSSGNITINLPTASATNRGLLSAADWTTFNNKANAGNYVTLDTTQTITAQKTFTTSGSSDTMIISHGSGSGFALDVLKAGNGEAIRVTKSSGTGNAMTISGGNFEAGTIVKTGGTSSQFLKADGSVDSSTYLTTGTASSTYVPYSGAAASVNLGVYSITANAINSAGSGSTAGQINLRSDAFFSLVNGYGSIASGTTNQFNLYQTTGAGVFRGAILSLNSITASATRTYTLPDASGTLALTTDIPSLAGYVTLATTQTITGAKTFDSTTSDFLILNSTNANGGTLTFRRNGTNVGHIGNSGVLGVGILDDLEVRSGIGKGLHLKTDGGKLTLSSGGSVTLDGALNGTSAVFSGAVTSDDLILTAGTLFGTGNTGFSNRLSDTTLYLQMPATGFNITDNALNTRFTLASTGAATFSSSVTAGGAITMAYGGNPRLTLQDTDAGAGNVGILFKEGTSDKWTLASVGGGFQFFNEATSSNAIFITSGNNVGIGTASPAKKLDVYESSTATVEQYIRNTTVNGLFKIEGTSAFQIGTETNHPVLVITNNQERLRINANGLSFNGDTAAANALDDYEEGTWTPIIGGAGGESGQSYGGQTGNYTKIGRLVTVNFRVVLSNKGTITGQVAIKGLPFVIQNSITYGGGVTYWGALATSWNYMFFMPAANESYATVHGTKSAVTETIQCLTGDIGNVTQFNGQFTYFTN